MKTSFFLTLLNPGMSLIFAATFFGLWQFKRDQRYLLTLSSGYALIATGFIFQLYAMQNALIWTTGMASLLFLIGICGVTLAVCQRYLRAPPVPIMAAIALAGISTYLFYWYVLPSLVMRVYAINFSIGGLMLVAAREVARSTRKAPIDRVLFAMLAIQGLLFFVRTLATVDPNELGNATVVSSSTYWLVFTFTNALLSVISALILAAAVVLDIVGDLQAQTKTDVLTRLMNRRGFEHTARSVLYDRSITVPVTLILADLDRFKRINDTFGHHAGDAVIVNFAGIVREVVGDIHAAGRIGGEEFAILVVGGDASTAKLVAQGIRMGFALTPTPFRRQSDEGSQMSASFGIAERRRGETYEQLMARADKALYVAKSAGRDCIRVDVEPQPSMKISDAALATG